MKKTDKKQRNKYIFHGENMSAYKILQLVSEEGTLELAKGIFLNTKEQLTFENEEEITRIEKSILDEPDDEDLQDDYIKYLNTNYKGSAYWITDGTDKIIGCIHNSKELETLIIRKKLLDVV